MKRAFPRCISSLALGLVVTSFLLAPARNARAQFLRVADLSTVVVAVDPSLIQRTHSFSVKVWVLLDFKEDQPANSLGLERPGFAQYRSRLDRVELNCRFGQYAQTATMVFGQSRAAGEPVFESIDLRSPNWRELRPLSYESAVWSYVCQGVSNVGSLNPPRPL